jgi:biotin synthase
MTTTFDSLAATPTSISPITVSKRWQPANAAYSLAEIEALFALPFNDLMHRAQTIHREHHDANRVQLSTLLSIKTGGCSEDCGYCPQAARYHTGVENEAMLDVSEVVATAKLAKQNGASRFCMGAAWRGPKERDLIPVLEMVREVKALGLETCCTLGMLKDGQAEQLKDAGLDYYNHNLDTTPEFYGDIVTTREYQDRLDTLGRVRDAKRLLRRYCWHGGITPRTRRLNRPTRRDVATT